MGNSYDKNRFIKGGLNIDLISEEDKKLINEIPKRDYTYVCKLCGQIPKIQVEYCEGLGYIKALYFIECRKKLEINIKSFDDNFQLMRVPLNDLKKDNYMKLKKFGVELDENTLPFESLNDFNEYVTVYRSYMKLKERILKYNSGDTNNNKLFSLFEDFLFIGLHSYNTRYEYENAIIIKDYLFTKFNIYSKEILLKNKQRLIKLNSFKINNIELFHIKNDLYALKKKENFNLVIIKFEKLLDETFVPDEYVKYAKYRDYDDIPAELRKNYLIVYFKSFVENRYLRLENIFSFGENNYLLDFSISSDHHYYKFIFEENDKNYLREKFVIHNKDPKRAYVLKNNKIVAMTSNDLYIYEYNNKNKKNIFEVVKIYLNLNKNNYYNYILSFVELHNGDFVFNFGHKIICISHYNYQIKCIVNLKKNIERLSTIGDETIKIGLENGYYSYEGYYLNLSKMKLYEHFIVGKYVFNEDIKKRKRYDLINNVYIEFDGQINFNQKDNNIQRINYDFGISKDVIVNKKKNIFGIRITVRKEDSFDVDIEKMIFYQLK